MKDLYLYIAQRIHPGSILVTVGFDCSGRSSKVAPRCPLWGSSCFPS
jgi:hypothetical protein